MSCAARHMHRGAYGNGTGRARGVMQRLDEQTTVMEYRRDLICPIRSMHGPQAHARAALPGLPDRTLVSSCPRLGGPNLIRTITSRPIPKPGTSPSHLCRASVLTAPAPAGPDSLVHACDTPTSRHLKEQDSPVQPSPVQLSPTRTRPRLRRLVPALDAPSPLVITSILQYQPYKTAIDPHHHCSGTRAPCRLFSLA